MSILDKMERKLGRFAIQNLMTYIIIGSVVVTVLSLANPYYIFYLYLIPSEVMRGQVWRLITFVFVPENMSNLFFTAISLYFYFFIGKMLEMQWGAFRFNMFYFLGVIFNIAACFLFHGIGTPSYLNETLFLAFAALFPDMTVLLFFMIPLKVKWLGYISAALLIYQFIVEASWAARGMILFSVLNFILFFAPSLIHQIRYGVRKQNYNRKVNYFQGPSHAAQPKRSKDVPKGGDNVVKVAFHRCYICGKTEQDDPNMQFRYCSKCGGLYEYCMDHLQNHTHIGGQQ